MHIAGSALKGYSIEATDGKIGTVKTFLFDDRTWKIRWLVVDTGRWLPGRQVLIQPSAIGHADHAGQSLTVNLTKAQVEASPDIAQDQPVTMQRQAELHSYYGADPYWGPNYFGGGLTGMGVIGGMGMPYLGAEQVRENDKIQLHADDGDPDLRSMMSVTGYNLRANDGVIGHVEDFLLDDATWTIRYLIVDTQNWWPGAHVLISPYAVQSVDWNDKEIRLNVSRDRVRASPPWDAAQQVDAMYERRLHSHYDWPGYGW